MEWDSNYNWMFVAFKEMYSKAFNDELTELLKEIQEVLADFAYVDNKCLLYDGICQFVLTYNKENE